MYDVEQICLNCMGMMYDYKLIGWLKCPACGLHKKKEASMITREELNVYKYPTTPEVRTNLEKLFTAINIIRAAWGKPMTVTSGLRSPDDQRRLIDAGKSKAKASNHLIGAAVDIKDFDAKLGEWCKANIGVLEKAGLWCEDPAYTNGWVHFQCVQPKSGHRFYIP